MSDPEPQLQSKSDRPMKGRGVSMMLGLLAVTAIWVGDRSLRTRESLIAGLVDHNVQIYIPFSDSLSQRVDKKTTINNLYLRLSADRSAGRTADFVKTSYDLAKFIHDELSPQDSRRKAVLLDLIAAAGSSPDAEQAYWALLEPDWNAELQPSYAAYAASLSNIGEGRGKAGLPLFEILASTMQSSHESALELNALRKIRDLSPITVGTESAIRRLLAVLPPSDPSYASVSSDLAGFEKRRDQLIAAMNWYSDFRTKSTAGLSEVEAFRATAPPGPMNPFFAAADATLASRYVKAGRSGDAARLRTTLANEDVGDVEEADALVLEWTNTPPAAPGKSLPSSVPMPDGYAITYNQWRGKLLAGQWDAAEQLAGTLFTGDFKSLKKLADDETQFAKGQWSRLSPNYLMQKRSDALPPELGLASEAWYANLPLKPIGKATPAEVHSSCELWMNQEKIVIVVTADEPRTNLPAPSIKDRDKDVFKDESVELFFNPDRWVDGFSQIDLNLASVVMDAEVFNNGTPGRRQLKTDRSWNTDVQSTTVKTANGWQLRIVLPREQLFPPGVNGIKFNARRLRHVTEKGQPITQSFAWTPNGGGPDVRPEQFGWLLCPQ